VFVGTIIHYYLWGIIEGAVFFPVMLVGMWFVYKRKRAFMWALMFLLAVSLGILVLTSLFAIFEFIVHLSPLEAFIAILAIVVAAIISLVALWMSWKLWRLLGSNPGAGTIPIPSQGDTFDAPPRTENPTAYGFSSSNTFGGSPEQKADYSTFLEQESSEETALRSGNPFDAQTSYSFGQNPNPPYRTAELSEGNNPFG